MNFIAKLENILRKGGSIKYVLILGIIAFFFKIPGSILGEWLFPFLGLTDPIFDADQQIPLLTFSDFILSVLIAPIFETLLGQFLPITLIALVTKLRSVQIIGSATVFALLHFPVVEFLPAAFCVGVILSWGYFIKLHEGKKKVFLLVSLIHALHNLIVYALAAFIV